MGNCSVICPDRLKYSVTTMPSAGSITGCGFSRRTGTCGTAANTDATLSGTAGDVAAATGVIRMSLLLNLP